jgi:HNH endonuclease
VNQSGGPDACWPWRAYCRPDGYGELGIGGGNHQLAHRYAWTLIHGPIPAETPNVLHHCDNQPCCNPKHLFLGTPRDNMDDKIAKGRAACGDQNGSRKHRERLRRGMGIPWAKLTDQSVREIRALYLVGDVSQYELARRYGVSQSQIHSVLSRKTWAHVEGGASLRT